MEDYRNPKPVEENSNVPMITLMVLIAMVIALLYVGWQSMSNDVEKTDIVLSTPPDAVAIKGQNDEDVVAAPSTETTSDENEEKNAAKAENEDVTESKKEKETKKVEEKKKEPEKKVEVITTKGETYIHTVQAGETFYGIANRYRLGKSALQKLNPDVEPEGIKVGITKLKVKVKAIHTVGPGDILRVVAQKYGVSKQAIMEANKKTKDITERGERLIIPIE
ncbi:LysM peptidoglycan-binding domain-containing protein [Arcicella rigui]|uniref:LysM peptidoglycan-binding domain-containing protein n=1 Tax=Arcicella rigui TaxID=797020 RepID=A0ABU5Q7U9_9BACT|nr:LysM peptidoglycan-binding domain-containing protein [Arcicella rigui]MEA5138921.1 LysM peptidoglycan-binding domain-containing protein [Arcicella rigui]